jgi:AraC-like DNA-binding protein/nitrogen-specific signal transduction histidine kinase
LRTPLSLIAGTIDMMQREQISDIPDSFQRDLESIHTGARHLSHLIGDVLDLTRSHAGELRLVCEPVRLTEVLERVMLLGEHMARERGLDWRVDFGESQALVWADRTRLQQVALNLVSNAVKFTARGHVSLWVEAGRHEVMVAVSDTGMGIPPSEQELIFDEFRRSDRAARRGFGGMGLGLAISKRLIDLHGGRIGVLSTGADGAGSTFYFTLPILARETPFARALPDRSDTVLLFIDGPGASRGPAGQSVHDYLVRRGFKVAVLQVDEHEDWLAQVIAAPPGAVVLDYEPAAERAWDLMHVLKLNPATSDIPVLFYSLSGASPMGDPTLQSVSGSVLDLDYLAKPIGGDVLAAALARQGIARDDGREYAILVVDDDPNIRALHERMLRAALPHCRVTTAENGRDALALMAHERPDLLLLDLMMPELSGFEVLESMRTTTRLRDVPVIVLTAQLLGRAEMERLQKGVAAVLSKGLFAEAEVLSQIEEALSRTGKRLGSEAQRIARMAMAHIHEHYGEQVSREDLARRLAVSERYLTRCFGQETGLTPIAYLNRYRVQRAIEMLQRDELTVTEIALACGFSDSSYFGRVFLRETGLPPSEYRKRRPGMAGY